MTDMTPLHFIFYLFATIAVISALIVISVRNPVRSVLALVVTFFAMAGVWMTLRAEFLSLTLILVYVGAVMTLFLFVVMTLNIDKADQTKPTKFKPYLYIGCLLLGLFIILLLIDVGPAYFGIKQMAAPAAEPADYSNITQLGRLLFTDYVYPFEVAGVILLAAIIAAITLAHRAPKQRRSQNPDQQIQVRPEDRVRLINMPPEKKAE